LSSEKKAKRKTNRKHTSKKLNYNEKDGELYQLKRRLGQNQCQMMLLFQNHIWKLNSRLLLTS